MAATTGNTSPIFIGAANLTPVRINAANNNPDLSSTASIFQLVTGSTDGTRVDGVRFRNAQNIAASASSAMLHRIYWYNGSGMTNSNFRLVGEVATAAATRSNGVTVGATSIYTFDQPLIMGAGQSLWVSQSVYIGQQDQFDAMAFAGNY